MNVLHTIASLNTSKGGPTRSVTSLCEWQGKAGSQINLLAQNIASEADQNIIPDASFVSTTFVPRSGSFLHLLSDIGRFKDTLIQICNEFKVEIIHDHGLWLPSNHIAASASCKLGLPLIIHTRGMLEPWALAYRAWKKKVAWLLYQKNDIYSAKVLCCTSDVEYMNLRLLGIKQPVAIIPNGVDLQISDSSGPELRPDGKRLALFIGRIHPVKGLINLVHAWKSINTTGWNLTIAGPDEVNHRNEIETCIRENKCEGSISLCDTVSFVEKSKLYKQADVFILPSFTENFGLVVAEALAHGTPVIASKGTPWRDLVTYDCGWWVDVGVQPLALAISEAIAMPPSELQQMGFRGKKLVEENYAWPSVAHDMLSVYSWILNSGAKPDCVKLD